MALLSAKSINMNDDVIAFTIRGYVNDKLVGTIQPRIFKDGICGGFLRGCCHEGSVRSAFRCV
jgi:hypothetical protein